MTVDIPKLRELVKLAAPTEPFEGESVLIRDERALVMVADAMPEVLDRIEEVELQEWAAREAYSEERSTSAALRKQLAELRPAEGAPDEAEELAGRLDRGEWSGREEMFVVLDETTALIRRLASELRGYRKAVTWGVDTVAEAYRLEAEKMREELAVARSEQPEWVRCIQKTERIAWCGASLGVVSFADVAHARSCVDPDRRIQPCTVCFDRALGANMRGLEERDAASLALRFDRWIAGVDDLVGDGSWFVMTISPAIAFDSRGLTKEAAIEKAKALAAREVK